jgi:hypothetical protein
MRYLSQGLESHKKVELLLKLTRISSENMQMALSDHLANNFTVAQSALINDVKVGNLRVALAKLNDVAETVERLYELKISMS